jgi:uncharacterized protein YceK
MIRKSIIFTTIVLMIFLSGCSTGSSTEKSVDTEGCIPPLTEFDLPLRVSGKSNYYNQPLENSC